LCDHYLLPADYRADEEDHDDEWNDYRHDVRSAG